MQYNNSVHVYQEINLTDFSMIDTQVKCAQDFNFNLSQERK